MTCMQRDTGYNRNVIAVIINGIALFIAVLEYLGTSRVQQIREFAIVDPDRLTIATDVIVCPKEFVAASSSAWPSMW